MYTFFDWAKLKDCPFCGGKAVAAVTSKKCGHGESSDKVSVYCEDCDVSFSKWDYSECNWRSRVEELSEKWNKRKGCEKCEK